MAKKIKHTSLGWSRDKKKRSKQRWERARGAKRKGNPSYRPVRVRKKGGGTMKVYKLRKR